MQMTASPNRTAPPAAFGEPQASAWLQSLLPDGIVTAELLGEDEAAALPGARRVASVAGSRAREFAAGRACAGRATGRLGAKPSALGRGPGGVPLWPESLTGSITHTAGYAAAAVGPRQRFRAIGIDAERIGGVTRDLWGQVFLPDEVRWLAGLANASQAQAATLLFSAKEAFYKCQFEVTGRWLEFRDVIVCAAGAEVSRGAFEVRPAGGMALGPGLRIPAVRYGAFGNLMLTAIAVAAY